MTEQDRKRTVDRTVPYAPNRSCVKTYRTAPDCLAHLAEGWITVMDLCGPCTARMMVAVDWVTNRDNAWHRGYVDRARDRVEPVRCGPCLAGAHDVCLGSFDSVACECEHEEGSER